MMKPENKLGRIFITGFLLFLTGVGSYAQEREIISHRFLVVRLFSNDMYGLEADGKQILPIEYKKIETQRENDNLFIVEDKAGKLGVVNNKGEFAVPLGNYKKIVFNEATILLYKDNVSWDSVSRHDLKKNGTIEFITSPVDKFKWSIPMSDDGELFRRTLSTTPISFQLYTKQGKPILNCKSIMPHAIPEWDGYKFFVVEQDTGKGMIMYKNGTYFYTIEPTYQGIGQARVIGNGTRFLTYVVSATKGYNEERFYMDGRPVDGHAQFKKPFLPEEWKKKEAETKTWQVSIGKTDASGLGIKSVTTAYDYTEIEFTYTEKKKEQGLYLNDNGEDDYFIRIGDKKYTQLKIVKDIDHKIKVGQTTTFIIRFLPIPSDATQFDILEGPNGQWNYYKVTLKDA